MCISWGKRKGAQGNDGLLTTDPQTQQIRVEIYEGMEGMEITNLDRNVARGEEWTECLIITAVDGTPPSPPMLGYGEDGKRDWRMEEGRMENGGGDRKLARNLDPDMDSGPYGDAERLPSFPSTSLAWPDKA